MNLRKSVLLLCCSITICLLACLQEDKSDEMEDIILEAIGSSHSGLDFNNKLIDDSRMHVFIWNFLYTGAGVATGDLNGDGLPDIYFTGNAVHDRMYINKGDFQFEDISSTAGIIDNLWSTGVTFADVNADGLLDVYVCKNSPMADPDRNRNKLFINKGDNKFEERAAEYGIADIGFSIQATFFDVDQDGDLDMYLVNQPFDQFARMINKADKVASYPSTDRLYIFERGRFYDKTEDLGLTNLRYGLNASLGDFNNDGWTDMYICNDYHHADHLYINTGNGFRDEIKERTGHISFYSMGSDVSDINNDGWQDVISVDMAFADHYRSKTNMGSMDPVFFQSLVDQDQHYQYAQNMLHLNHGEGHFSEIAQLAGISKTDWSAAPLFVDLDNDLDKDLLITNGIMKDMRNNDFDEMVKKKYGGIVGPSNYIEVIRALPSNPVPNLSYRNDGNYQFQDISMSSGFSFKGFSHGMAYADFDLDGSLDIVVNNMNAEAGLYRNTSGGEMKFITLKLIGPSKNTFGMGCHVKVHAGMEMQSATMQTTRGFLSASEPILHFGLRDIENIDSIVVIWNARQRTILRNVKPNQILEIDHSQSEVQNPIESRSEGLHLLKKEIISFKHEESEYNDYQKQVLLPYKLSQNGPHVSSADLNEDGQEELFVGGAANQVAQLFTPDEQAVYQPIFQESFESDKHLEDQQSCFFDADSDGDLDLFVVSGSNETSIDLEHRLYINEGNQVFTKMYSGLKNNSINSKCVIPFDADGDDDMDLFIGGRLVAGRYPLPASSALLINEKGTFSDRTDDLAPSLVEFGLVTDGITDDVDEDGDLDLILVGEWMNPVVLLNNGEKGFERKDVEVAGRGIWWSIEKGDFDKDGDRDFLLGNLGWNNKFGGRKEPPTLEIYAGDLDQNGDHDIVLATTKGEHILPLRGRECSSQEMPFILERFNNYDAYGKATLIDILSDEQMKNATHLEVDRFSSILLQNNGDLAFEIIELPVECQFGPIRDFIVHDINGDNKLDFYFGGNHFPTEVETARYDGLYLGACINHSSGDFEYLPVFLEGTNNPLKDIRDLHLLKHPGGKAQLLIAENNGALEIFE